MSFAGKTCAVLLESGVKTYTTAALKELSSFDGTGGRCVIAQKDGSVLVTDEYVTKCLK